jgi:hypothetical protein
MTAAQSPFRPLERLHPGKHMDGPGAVCEVLARNWPEKSSTLSLPPYDSGLSLTLLTMNN